MLLFFLAWELELIPVYSYGIWGGRKRQYAATKFILYTAGSSLFILLVPSPWPSAAGDRSALVPDLAAKHLGAGSALVMRGC